MVLDKQVLDKQKAKLQLQQDKVQDAQDLAVTLKQHKIDEAKAAAARRSAALQTKALMAGQVGQTHRHVSHSCTVLTYSCTIFTYSCPRFLVRIDDAAAVTERKDSTRIVFQQACHKCLVGAELTTAFALYQKQ